MVGANLFRSTPCPYPRLRQLSCLNFDYPVWAQTVYCAVFRPNDTNLFRKRNNPTESPFFPFSPRRRCIPSPLRICQAQRLRCPRSAERPQGKMAAPMASQSRVRLDLLLQKEGLERSKLAGLEAGLSVSLFSNIVRNCFNPVPGSLDS